MSNLPKRKKLRLNYYDYSKAGYYFVTICKDNRKSILSKIPVGAGLCSARKTELTPIGEIVQNEIKELEKRYNAKIEPYIIMPNHVHMMLKLTDKEIRAEQSPAPTLGDIICTFKSLTTKAVNKKLDCLGQKLWQRNYYEHIIRSEQDYLKAYQYITYNCLKHDTNGKERF